MKVTIVTIGDEILIGQVTDTNSVWMAQELIENGFDVEEMISISDRSEHINVTLDRLIGKVDVVLMTGGLGPTKDDLTKQTLNAYFGGKMVIHRETLQFIEDFFTKRGRGMLETNRNQSLVPDVCKVILNKHGSAPGMWFEREGTQLIAMPGVPYEMKPMVRNDVLPQLRRFLAIPDLVKQTVMTYGVPESFLAEMIKAWEEDLPACMKLAYLPRPGIVRLRLTVQGECTEMAQEMLTQAIEGLKLLIGEHIFAYEDILLEKVLGEKLREMEASVAVAESCTGGNIGRMMTSVAGSSNYFKGGVIAYSNEIKQGMLGVSEASLKNFGAVAKEVVEEMARGVRERFQTSYGISVSGIAGPDGGTDEKPVGTVWIAVANEDTIVSRMHRFGGSRNLIVQQASIAALSMLHRIIVNKVVHN